MVDLTRGRAHSFALQLPEMCQRWAKAGGKWAKAACASPPPPETCRHVLLRAWRSAWAVQVAWAPHTRRVLTPFPDMRNTTGSLGGRLDLTCAVAAVFLF